MSEWTLTVGGTERGFAALGIELNNCVLTRNNGAADVFTFSTPVRFDGTPLVAYDQAVTIRRDRTGAGTSWSGGAIYFVGYGTPPQCSAQGTQEAISYELRNWWWKAERTIYKHAWQQYAGTVEDEPTFTQVAYANVFLGQSVTGDRFTNGAQINDALTWLKGGANGRGIAVTIGTIDPAVNIFTTEARSMSVAEVIRTMLAHSPDAVVITDYSTETPTVHVRSLANLTAATLTVGTDNISGLGLRARTDLQVPVVVVTFRTTSSDNGHSYVSWSKQVYPPAPGGWTAVDWEGQVDAVNHMIELQGPSRTSVQGYFKTETINANHADATARLNWWKKREPTLNSAFIGNITIATPFWIAGADNIAIDLEDYPQQLIDGGIADWMGYTSRREITIKARATFSIYSTAAIEGVPPPDGYIVKKVVEREFAVKITVTDAPEGEYTPSATASVDSGEAEPAGLAQNYYNSLATLQHEGEVADVNHELPAGNLLAYKLTLAGTGLSIGSQLIQGTSENIGRGTRRVRIGPANVLDLRSLMDLHRVSRVRRIWNNPAMQTTGESSGSESVQLPQNSPHENTTNGAGTNPILSVSSGFNEVRMDVTGALPSMRIQTGSSGDGLINLDLATALGRTIQLRQAKVCTPTATKYCLVLASDVYDEPLAGGSIGED